MKLNSDNKRQNGQRAIATIRRLTLFALVLSPFFLAQVLAQDHVDQSQTPPSRELSETNQACLGCHDPEAESGPAVLIASLARSPHKDKDCTDCHSSFTADAPHSAEMKADKVRCGSCHVDQDEAVTASVHGKTPAMPGDTPTCKSCHVDKKDPHGIVPIDMRTRESRVRTCEQCHADAEKMARNGVNVGAVASYEASFHGKALLRFGKQDTAICVSCHTSHSVLPPSDPNSTVGINRVRETCGQAGCHPGATMNFAMSGANHIELKVHESPFLNGVLWFFRILVVGMTGFLLMGVFLDMRRSIFGKHPPPCGRSVGFLIAMGFLSIVAAILLAAFNRPGALTPTIIGVSLLLLSLVVYRLDTPRVKRAESQRMFHRLSLSLRLQHFVLMIAFTLLIVTGMPVRQSESDVLRNFYMMIGGLEVGRWIHRIAGLMLIGVFTFHVFELLLKWKRAGFTLKSWTMLPTKKDVTDFVQTSKYYAGMTNVAPRYGRFQFREKLDYFAEYWGIPLMGFTGLVLWFPVFFSTYMPEETVSVAYIAHSYEAVLAFLAILTWHMYNTHFNPTTFPMNPSWLTGSIPEAAMQHEHPLEMEEILAKEALHGVPEESSEQPKPAATSDGEAATDDA